MNTDPAKDAATGAYVHTPEYLLMRLSTLLTGSAAPNEAEWGNALKRLLTHVATHPVPGTPEARAREFAAAWGVRMAAAPAPVDETEERETI